MEQTPHRIVVLAGGYEITGTIVLPSEGYRSRLTDYLNSAERDFVPMTDVTIQPVGRPEEAATREFVALSRQAITLAMPAS